MDYNEFEQAMDKYKELKENGYKSLDDKIYQENKRRAIKDYDKYLSNGGY